MAAIRFALAAALVEYPYAYVAVRFEDLLFSTAVIESNFELIGAIVMIALGVISWWNHRKPGNKQGRFMSSGFRRGIIISLLNPLAIPFWIGVTAYLRFQGWVEFNTELDYHLYVAGVSTGTFALLLVVTLLSSKLGERFSESKWIRLMPAIAFLLLGIYGMIGVLLG